MALDLHSIVVASKDQMASAIDNEIVILGLSAGRYYGVDAVGARIWRMIQEPVTVESIGRTIIAEYEVDSERCQQDVLNLLERMIEAGLAEVRGEPDDRSTSGTFV